MPGVYRPDDRARPRAGRVPRSFDKLRMIGAKGGRRVHPRLPVLAPSAEEAAHHLTDMVRNVK